MVGSARRIIVAGTARRENLADVVHCGGTTHGVVVVAAQQRRCQASASDNIDPVHELAWARLEDSAVWSRIDPHMIVAAKEAHLVGSVHGKRGDSEEPFPAVRRRPPELAVFDDPFIEQGKGAPDHENGAIGQNGACREKIAVR